LAREQETRSLVHRCVAPLADLSGTLRTQLAPHIGALCRRRALFVETKRDAALVERQRVESTRLDAELSATSAAVDDADAVMQRAEQRRRETSAALLRCADETRAVAQANATITRLLRSSDCRQALAPHVALVAAERAALAATKPRDTDADGNDQADDAASGVVDGSSLDVAPLRLAAKLLIACRSSGSGTAQRKAMTARDKKLASACVAADATLTQVASAALNDVEEALTTINSYADLLRAVPTSVAFDSAAERCSTVLMPCVPLLAQLQQDATLADNDVRLRPLDTVAQLVADKAQLMTMARAENRLLAAADARYAAARRSAAAHQNSANDARGGGGSSSSSNDEPLGIVANVGVAAANIYQSLVTLLAPTASERATAARALLCRSAPSVLAERVDAAIGVASLRADHRSDAAAARVAGERVWRGSVCELRAALTAVARFAADTGAFASLVVAPPFTDGSIPAMQYVGEVLQRINQLASLMQILDTARLVTRVITVIIIIF
jgi:hypothetical protein